MAERSTRARVRRPGPPRAATGAPPANHFMPKNGIAKSGHAAQCRCDAPRSRRTSAATPPPEPDHARSGSRPRKQHRARGREQRRLHQSVFPDRPQQHEHGRLKARHEQRASARPEWPAQQTKKLCDAEPEQPIRAKSACRSAPARACPDSAKSKARIGGWKSVERATSRLTELCHRIDRHEARPVHPPHDEKAEPKRARQSPATR